MGDELPRRIAELSNSESGDDEAGRPEGKQTQKPKAKAKTKREKKETAAKMPNGSTTGDGAGEGEAPQGQTLKPEAKAKKEPKPKKEPKEKKTPKSKASPKVKPDKPKPKAKAKASMKKMKRPAAAPKAKKTEEEKQTAAAQEEEVEFDLSQGLASESQESQSAGNDQEPKEEVEANEPEHLSRQDSRSTQYYGDEKPESVIATPTKKRLKRALTSHDQDPRTPAEPKKRKIQDGDLREWKGMVPWSVDGSHVVKQLLNQDKGKQQAHVIECIDETANQDQSKKNGKAKEQKEQRETCKAKGKKVPDESQDGKKAEPGKVKKSKTKETEMGKVKQKEAMVPDLSNNNPLWYIMPYKTRPAAAVGNKTGSKSWVYVQVKGASLEEHIELCQVLLEELQSGKPLPDVKLLAGYMKKDLAQKVSDRAEKPGSADSSAK